MTTLSKFKKDTLPLWRKSANCFVKSVFRDNFKLSNQQSETFTEMGKIIMAKEKLSKGLKLTDEEATYAKYIGLNVPAGMGLGKTLEAAIAAVYFLTVFPDFEGQSPHVMVISNTAKQLKNVFWRQLAGLLPMSRPLTPSNPASKTILEDLFVWQTEKFYLRTRGGNRHFAEAVTIPQGSEEEQAKALTGRHAPYMLMILDEASGLPEPVFKNIESTLTGKVNIIMMIYNPTKSRGYVADAANSDRWLTIRWDGEETCFDNPHLDLPLKARNEDLLKKYKVDSNAYRIRVKGLPPLDDKEHYIPYEWVQNAVDREMHVDDNDPIIMGVDPAGGGDETAIAIRQGSNVRAILGFNTPDKDECLRKILEVASEWEPACIVLDFLYNGWYLTDKLEKVGFSVIPILAQSRARNPLLYKNLRAEMWETVKEHFRRGTISIPNDMDLIDQYSNIKNAEFFQGQLKLPSKQQMKKTIGCSPDRADAMNLTFAVDDNRFRRYKNMWLPAKAPEIPLFATRNTQTGY